jgi:hypothetical protein
MQIQIGFPSAQVWKALGRHVVTYSAGFATGAVGLLAYAVTFHFMSSDQATALGGGLTNIASGLKMIVSGVATVWGGALTCLSVLSALWSAYSSTHKSVTQQTASIPGTTIVTTPAIAAETPQENIVSNENHAVIPQTPPAPKV